MTYVPSAARGGAVSYGGGEGGQHNQQDLGPATRSRALRKVVSRVERPPDFRKRIGGACGFGAKQVQAPEAVLAVTEKGEPGRPGGMRFGGDNVPPGLCERSTARHPDGS